MYIRNFRTTASNQIIFLLLCFLLLGQGLYKDYFRKIVREEVIKKNDFSLFRYFKSQYSQQMAPLLWLTKEAMLNNEQYE